MPETLPLREPTYLILAALAPAPAHGYGIIKAINEMSSGRITMRAGTLYGAIERLAKDGYVEFAGEASEGGPPRRYYRLTPAGAELLRAEAQRLADNAALGLSRLDLA